MGSLEPPQVGSRQRRARPGKIDAPLGKQLAAAKWGEFKVTDIFKVRNTHSILSADIVPGNGTTPYLCASAENNAVSSYIDYKAELKEAGNCIFIGGKTFVVSYQESDFFSNDSHNLALYLNDADSATRPRLLFMASCIARSLGHKYTWGDSISKQKIKEDFVTLPVTAAGEIDFAFMDAFIRELEEERIRELAAYLTASGLADSKLSASERNALARFTAVEWREFRLGDLFDVCSYKKRFDANKVKILDKGGHPYIVRMGGNNGQKGWIDEDPQYLNPGNTISFGQDTATMFYQEKSYFTGDKIKILKPKDARFGKGNAQVFLAAMRRTFATFSWGTTSFSIAALESRPVSLPATASGEPDYGYMETFMRAVQKLVVKDVADFAARRISATKRCIAAENTNLSACRVAGEETTNNNPKQGNQQWQL